MTENRFCYCSLNVCAQEKADQTRRVKDMARSIVELEQKVEELSKPDNTVAEMVQQAQMMAETEIRNFQEEAEKYFARSLAELKVGHLCILFLMLTICNISSLINCMWATKRTYEISCAIILHTKSTMHVPTRSSVELTLSYIVTGSA
jgi:methylthioribose-1-phosphate isomerase